MSSPILFQLHLCGLIIIYSTPYNLLPTNDMNFHMFVTHISITKWCITNVNCSYTYASNNIFVALMQDIGKISRLIMSVAVHG